jgi:predicted GIY-YIG superfamily endonuclease
MNMVEFYPFRTSDFSLPQSNTGYVYFLVSLVSQDEVYVGQTGRNIPVRLNEHNLGRGAHGTETATFMPWGVAAYIDKMSYVTEEERKDIEKKWQNTWKFECEDLFEQWEKHGFGMEY